MLDRLQRLKDSLEGACRRFEAYNEQGLNDYRAGAFYAEEYFGNHVDDAFDKGMDFGVYFAERDMLDEINKIIEEGK